jgi:hypothetical protein
MIYKIDFERIIGCSCSKPFSKQFPRLFNIVCYWCLLQTSLCNFGPHDVDPKGRMGRWEGGLRIVIMSRRLSVKLSNCMCSIRLTSHGLN